MVEKMLMDYIGFMNDKTVCTIMKHIWSYKIFKCELSFEQTNFTITSRSKENNCNYIDKL